MTTCHTCGNDYDKAFTVTTADGSSYAFDSFECALHALAPSCAQCGVRIAGHGLEHGERTYCCAHCASMDGAKGLFDRV